MLPGYAPSGQLCPVCTAPHFPFCPQQPILHPRFVTNHIQHFHQRPAFPQGDNIRQEPRFGAPPIAPEAPRPPIPPYYPQGFPSPVVEEHHHPHSHLHHPHPYHRPHLSLPYQDQNQFQSGGDLMLKTMMRPQQGINNRMINFERNVSSFQQQRVQVGKDDRPIEHGSVHQPFPQQTNYYNGEYESTNGIMRNHYLPRQVVGNFSEWPHRRQVFQSEVAQTLEASQNMHKEINVRPSPVHGHVTVPNSSSLPERQSNIHFNNPEKEGFNTQRDAEFQKHGLKRKLPMSREEELLIEKGLLDNEENPMPHKSSHQNGQTMQKSRCIGGLNEANISISPEKMMASWPNEKFSGKGWQNVASQELSQTDSRICKEEFQDGRQTNELLLQRQNKEFLLQRQYEEWEAEEKRMETLKKAETIAKEIQLREERNTENLYDANVTGKRNQGNMNLKDNPLFKVTMNEHNLPQTSNISTYSSQPQPFSHYSDLHSSNHDYELQQTSVQYGKQGHHQRQNIPQKPYFPEQSLPSSSDEQSRETSMQHWKGPPNAYGGFWHQSGPEWQEKHNAMHITHELGQCHENNLQLHQSCEQKAFQYKQLIGSMDTQGQPPASAYLANLDENAHKSGFGQNVHQARLTENALQSGHQQTGITTGHGGIPPLPPASINPPPPCSPPPPLPPSDYLPENIPPLPTSPLASHVMHGASGNQPHCISQHDQNLLTRSRGYTQEPMRPQHMLRQSHAPPQVERLKTIDAVSIFRSPGRLTRPDRFVVILRGLPGSGKSYLAKALRDVEVMNGGSAPRIHSMDDYFMSEVEKVEEPEMKSNSFRSNQKIIKKVMEYCYEPEMEEAYRASMLKAFRKTLEEGMFKFIIVDDRNVLIADFAQFWAIAKRSGYEVYVLEASYTDIKGCAARNVHNFTEEQVKAMADRWEPTPLLYLKLDVSLLFRGDDLNTQDIIEVEMDADDMEQEEEEEEHLQSSNKTSFGISSKSTENSTWGDRWEDDIESVNGTFASPVTSSLVGEHTRGHGGIKKSNENALSGLMTTYGKKDKFVHWSDNEGNSRSKVGFMITSGPQKGPSLIIGPGPGYNRVSNPPTAEDDTPLEGELKKISKFTEQLRAEQETFKAVLARRRQRIHTADDDDED